MKKSSQPIGFIEKENINEIDAQKSNGIYDKAFKKRDSEKNGIEGKDRKPLDDFRIFRYK